jgi:glutamate 5-kinase
VVKVGSSLLSTPDGLDRRRIRSLAEDVETLARGGREFVLVTSGAIAAGVARLGGRHRPTTIREKQAAAAVGQIELMAFYEEVFSALGRHVAQMLLTREDLAQRHRYLNAKHTLVALLERRVLPIVNENDTVAVEEIRFGDNDNLSADVAALAEADLLVILTDVDGLHTADPTRDPSARRIPVVSPGDREVDRYAASRPGRLGTGGMLTKLQAARKAARVGIPTIIADGRPAGALRRLFDPENDAGTFVPAPADRLARRKHWIAFTSRPRGSLHLDSGAVSAIRDGKRSLLPSGVRAVDGEFGPGDCVRCLGPDGREVARGLVNYSAAEARRIAGAKTRDIEGILGYKISDEMIHRDDLVIL